jgi:hypothetical protein
MLWYHRNVVVTCRHSGKGSCVRCAATFVFFQEIKFFTAKQEFFKFAVIFRSSVHCVWMSFALTLRCTVHDPVSVGLVQERFRLWTKVAVNIGQQKAVMSDSIRHYLLSVSSSFFWQFKSVVLESAS